MQGKTSKNMKNQGNMIISKDQINFPVSKSKGMEICDLTDKEFKILVLRKLNELQENTEKKSMKSGNKNKNKHMGCNETKAFAQQRET